MACGLSPIDWSAPWLQAWRELGEPIAKRVAQGVSVDMACNEALKAPKNKQAQGACHVEFVPQSELHEGKCL